MAWELIIPAQIRGGRALIGLTQEQMALAAGIGLSAVRDAEGERRSGDAPGVQAIAQALVSAGVQFLPGGPESGPGVRLMAGRPNVIRRPARMQGAYMPFSVEWAGREITVILPRETMNDLRNGHGRASDEEYVATFDLHRGPILNAVGRELVAGHLTADDRLQIVRSDIMLNCRGGIRPDLSAEEPSRTQGNI